MASAALLFDVYLIGAKDKSPPAQMRLVGAIAARYRLSAPVVAQALEGVPYRVAEKLAAREAQELADALAAMGALARVAPTAATDVPGNARGKPAPAPSPPTVTARIVSTPPDELVSFPPHRDGRITLKSADVERPLVVDVSEPIEFAEPGPEGKTGVRGSDTARCPIHGLMYNRRKASGCLRCLASARAQARKLKGPVDEMSSTEATGFSALRDNPVRRAFWGLAVALLLGFLPAAYYARVVNRADLNALRARQGALSSLAVTRESLARFDALDAAVDQAHRRGATRTLMIWVVVGGIAGAVWTRLTRSTLI